MLRSVLVVIVKYIYLLSYLHIPNLSLSPNCPLCFQKLSLFNPFPTPASRVIVPKLNMTLFLKSYHGCAVTREIHINSLLRNIKLGCFSILPTSQNLPWIPGLTSPTTNLFLQTSVHFHFMLGNTTYSSRNSSSISSHEILCIF